jgi:Tol biopolymer transport system component
MGEVYRARDSRLGRDVAIKKSNAQFTERFEREARSVAALNHANICTLYDVGPDYLVMEFIEGPTLADRIAQGPLPLDEALNIAGQVADALEAAHEKGIVHRDLKPANIKITPSGVVKVLDFGLATVGQAATPSGDPRSSPTLTMAGVIMGTAGYMSPEQARGQAVDRRADIWAFGVVLHEMLTGKQLFGADTVADSMAAVLTRDPGLTQVPPQVRRLLATCLQRDPRNRLRDIGDWKLLLGETGPIKGQPRAMLWWAVAASLLALAGVVLAVIHGSESRPNPAVVRFQVQPESAEFDPIGGLALSPDGRRIAFVANRTDGRRMLWLHSLDSLTAYPMPGTEEAVYLPFWSPDGRFIAFGATDRLKKLDVSGGPPQVLAEAPGLILGGTWNRDGVILFGLNAGALFRVSQSGGTTSRLPAPDDSKGEIGFLRPSFLPDGRHYIYFARTRNTGDAGIWIASLDGTERRRLVTSAQAGAYAPPAPGERYGHLLYLRGGTLMAHPMDPHRYVLTGEPVTVADQVGSYLAMPYFSVSANGVLAYRAGPSGGESRELVWFDRTGKRLGTVGAPGQYSGGVSLSPDGRTIAVERRDVGNIDIWLIDIARGVPTRFTFDSANDRDPVWSPDGSRVAFQSERDGGRQLYVKQANGSGKEQLLLRTGIQAAPNSWSPDGSQLLFDSFDSAGMRSFDLWTLTLSQQQGATTQPAPYLQSEFTDLMGQFSPDGRWVAYTSSESGGGRRDVYVQSFPPGNGKFQISTSDGGSQPRWSRDGKQIFYIAPGSKLMAADVKLSPRFEVGVPRALFDTGVSSSLTDTHFRYDVAPDGRFLIATTWTAAVKPASGLTVVLNWQAGVGK